MNWSARFVIVTKRSLHDTWWCESHRSFFQQRIPHYIIKHFTDTLAPQNECTSMFDAANILQPVTMLPNTRYILGGEWDFQMSIYVILFCLGWFLIKNDWVWWSQNICDVFRSQDISGFLYPCVHIYRRYIGAHGKYRWVLKWSDVRFCVFWRCYLT